MRRVHNNHFADFRTDQNISNQTCSVEWIVVQSDGAEGKLHGSACYPLIGHC